ncbi:YsnF/AvaK domain-containing protein [Phormidesmis sp. 146-33]
MPAKSVRKREKSRSGKHVETTTARTTVPIEKERVVIDRTTPIQPTTIDPSDAAFREGEVAHMNVYEETPDIRKEGFVQEEVRVRKEVEQDTVTAEEPIRREQLDVDTQGQLIVEH